MAVNRERKMVPERECYINVERKLSDLLQQVKRLIKDYGPDAYIDGQPEPYSESDRETMYVFTMRPEDDAEYNKRIAYEEKWTKECEDRDAAEFKRLQAKFGVTK